MGTPVLGSVSSSIFSPASAVPLMPCSGASRATNFKCLCFAIRSISEVLKRSMPEWLVIRPTRFPRSARGTLARKVSMPGRTGDTETRGVTPGADAASADGAIACAAVIAYAASSNKVGAKAFIDLTITAASLLLRSHSSTVPSFFHLWTFPTTYATP
jgi:hypothetical protein